jgi:hypothetical protein
VRLLLAFLLTAAVLFGETFKLYLKDGGYHVVRQYQLQQDRIRYYSTERGDWEEIPAELVDLAKTERERNAKSEEAASSAKEQDEEEKAEREQRREIASIPMETGAYYKVDGQIKGLKVADYQVITNKRRRALQVLSPIPLIPGKASVVIKGEHSSFDVREERPDFFLRLEKQERFGIVTLTPKKGMRVVEDISMIPVSKENIEQRKQMDTFEQELASGLYRIWPQKLLAAGEYALVEFSDKGEGDPNEVQLLVWDFAVKPGAQK